MRGESFGEYSYDDLCDFSAARNIEIDLSTVRPQRVSGPLLSGRIFSSSIQPGLCSMAYDVSYTSDITLGQRCGRSLLLAMQVAGEAEPMVVEGAGSVAFRPGLAAAIAMGDHAECSGSGRAGQRCAAVGVVLSPEFFERFDPDDGDASLDTLEALVEGDAVVRRMGASERLSQLAVETLDAPYEGRLARLFLESAALAFVAEAGRLTAESSARLQSLSARQYERMVEVKRTVDADPFDIPSIAALAQRAGVGASTLRAHYRKAFGVGLFDYVRKRRFELAQSLLRGRKLSVAEVAYRVGFKDQAAFATAFRRRFGYPPSHEAERL